MGRERESQGEGKVETGIGCEHGKSDLLLIGPIVARYSQGQGRLEEEKLILMTGYDLVFVPSPQFH